MSQLELYNRCPWAYKLKYVDKAPQRPAAWLPQGIGFHGVAEERERAELSGGQLGRQAAADLFRRLYNEEVNKLADEWAIDHWFWSGPYDPFTDIMRRLDIGLDQVERYYDYREANTHEAIWIAEDGTPGIEMPFDIELGGIPVRGFIDQVLDRVRDLKTGNTPGGPLQLAVYAEALRQLYGLDLKLGDYWMARAGGPTVPYRLHDWTTAHLTKLFVELDEAIRAEFFEADPEPSKCRFCSVRQDCLFAA